MSSVELWPKQREALEFALGRDEVALLCEQRTGKTYITVALLEQLADDQFCGLLVCLLNNKETTWLTALKKFLPQLNVTTDWEVFKKLPSPRLLVVHFDKVRGIITKLQRYKKFNWCGVDEAHRIYQRGSRQSKALGRMSWVRRKLILTGTPIEKEPQNLFGQFRFLAPDVLGEWADFERKWLVFRRLDLDKHKPGSPQWVHQMMLQRILRSKAEFDFDLLPEFLSLVGPYCYRLTQEDVGIVRPTVERVSVPMTSTQRRYYDQLDRDMFVELDSGVEVTADMEATKRMKLRQIACGFVYNDDEEVDYFSGAKVRRIKSMVASLRKPIIVFSAFKPEVLRIYTDLVAEGYSVALVYGKTKKTLRPQIWRDFQAGRFDVIVCQTRTGGVGVDLWKANNAIVASMTESFIDWDQALARMSVLGKSIQPRVFVLCSTNSIDEDLFDGVFVKRSTGERVLQPIREGTTRWPRPRPSPPPTSRRRR